MKKECLVIIGEPSGEEHARSFLPQLMQSCSNYNFFGVAGDEMESHGVELVYHLKDFSSVGFTEVMKKLPFYLGAMKKIIAQVEKRQCKKAILIDFQGFNLKLAKKLKKMGVDVLYYVAPQAWAWKEYRAKDIADSTHTLFTILPFEKKWFQERGVKNVISVPHPLSQKYLENKQRDEIPSDLFKTRALKLLILPGSRKAEVSKMLPLFNECIDLLKKSGVQVECAIVKLKHLNDELYKNTHHNFKTWFSEDLQKASEWADFCLATSGTVTLSLGLMGLPSIVSYKLSLVNKVIAKTLIKYDGPVSLTNLMHNEYIFPELLLDKATPDQIVGELMKYVKNADLYNKTIKKLSLTREKLSGQDTDIAKYMQQVLEQ